MSIIEKKYCCTIYIRKIFLIPYLDIKFTHYEDLVKYVKKGGTSENNV